MIATKRQRAENKILNIIIEFSLWSEKQIMIYDKNKNLLSIITHTKQKIDQTIIPKELPNRIFVEWLISFLNNQIFGIGTILKILVFDYDECVIFDSTKNSFYNIKKGKIVSDSEIPSIFEQKLLFYEFLKMLSYNDVVALQKSSKKMLEQIYKFNIWEMLFQRDFPEIYYANMLTKKTTDYLDSISNERRTGGYKRPYWKLLYEYQFKNTFNEMEQKIFFERRQLTTICKSGAASINYEYINYLPLNSDEEEKIYNTKLNSIYELYTDKKGYRSEYFEKNECYMFMVLKDQKNRLIIFSDLQGNIIHTNNIIINENKDWKYYVGLIGDNYCFYNNSIFSKERVIINFTNLTKIKTCYTPSNCYVTLDIIKNEVIKKISLYEIKSEKVVFLCTCDIDAEYQNITFTNKWIICHSSFNFTAYSVKDGSKKQVSSWPDYIENIYDNVCIVGDYLYFLEKRNWFLYKIKLTTMKVDYYILRVQSGFTRLYICALGIILLYDSGYVLYKTKINTIKLVSCAYCTNSAAQYLCGNYCGSYYCNVNCQTLDWKNDHFAICKKK